jgi:hypothetical protein
MTQPSRRFELIADDQADETSAPAGAPAQPFMQRVSTDMLVMALKALSQRFVVALLQLFTLVVIGSVFAIWVMIPDPNPLQIISHSIYTAFALAVLWLVRRR